MGGGHSCTGDQSLFQKSISPITDLIWKDTHWILTVLLCYEPSFFGVAVVCVITLLLVITNFDIRSSLHMLMHWSISVSGNLFYLFVEFWIKQGITNIRIWFPLGFLCSGFWCLNSLIVRYKNLIECCFYCSVHYYHLEVHFFCVHIGPKIRVVALLH